MSSHADNMDSLDSPPPHLSLSISNITLGRSSRQFLVFAQS